MKVGRNLRVIIIFVVIKKTKSMIRHTVVYKLKYPRNSPEEREFLSAISQLSKIPGVRNFESFRQIGKKNDFEYGLSMDFNGAKEYGEYNGHPDHQRFVQTYWINYIDKFMEIDFESLI